MTRAILLRIQMSLADFRMTARLSDLALRYFFELQLVCWNLLDFSVQQDDLYNAQSEGLCMFPTFCLLQLQH